MGGITASRSNIRSIGRSMHGDSEAAIILALSKKYPCARCFLRVYYCEYIPSMFRSEEHTLVMFPHFTVKPTCTVGGEHCTTYNSTEEVCKHERRRKGNCDTALAID